MVEGDWGLKPEVPLPASRRNPTGARVLLLLLSLGMIGGFLMLGLVALMGQASGRTGTITPLFSVFAIGLILGVMLVIQAILALAGRPSRPFSIGTPWFWFALFVAVLLAVYLTPSLGAAASALLEGLGGMLPGIAVLAYAGRRLRRVAEPGSWRQVLAQSGSGLSVSTTISVIVEAIVIVLIVLVVIGIAAGLPGGQGTVNGWLQRLQSPAALQDPALQRELFQIPLVAGALLVFAVLAVPVVEELSKSAGVLTMGGVRRPSAAQAVLWGLAAGAGFAAFEGILSGGLLRMSGEAGLSSLLLARSGTTLMHCAAAGLTALGVCRALQAHRAGPAVKFYVGAMVLHGIWNLSALGVGLAPLYLTGSATDIVTVAGEALLVLLAIIAAAIVALLVRAALREGTPPPVSGPEIPAATP
jgi:RsiW-degrading membrane proteinase PrsW (M82 family)